jgi:hypothetical protein
MAYYIFLKTLRSLEEFRKNPHVKIPPKSPATNFQSLSIIKNQFFIRKKNFFTFGPEWPSGQSARPTSQPGHSPWCPLLPRAVHARSAHPGMRGLGVIARNHLFFEFAQPGGYVFPSVTAMRAPLVSSIVSPVPPLPLRRCLAPRMPPSFYSSPSSLPPLNPLQIEH